MAEPKPQDFVAGIAGRLDMVSYLAYLFHPEQLSFKDFPKDRYPEGLRDKLAGFMQLAQMFGMDGNLIAPQIEEIVDTLTPEKIVDILAELDEKQFTELYGNEALKDVIDSTVKTFVDEELKAVTFGEALELGGSGINIAIFGDLKSIKLSEITEEQVRDATEDLSNAQVDVFLDSLSDEQKAKFYEKLTFEEDGITPLKDAKGNLVTTSRFAGLPAEKAIEERARIGLEKLAEEPEDDLWSQLKSAWVRNSGGTHNEHHMNRAKAEVYNNIKEKLPAVFMETLDSQRESLATATDIPATEMYKKLREKLEDPEEKAKLTKLIADQMEDKDGKEGIKSKLRKNTDIAFLAQFFPDMVNEKISEGIRNFLSQQGWLQPILGIVAKLLGFVGNFLGNHAPQLKEKFDNLMNPLNIVAKPEGISAEQRDAAAGQTQTTTEEPAPDGETPASAATPAARTTPNN